MLEASMDTIALKGIKPKQHLQSYSFQELYIDLIEKVSYRETADTMNRFLHLDGESALRPTTLEDRISAFGGVLSSAYEAKAESILDSHNVDKSSGIVTEKSDIPLSVRTPNLPPVHDEKHIRSLIAEYNRGRDTLMKLKYGKQNSDIELSAERCCYISIDDVGVKFQKDKRTGNTKRSKKYVENTVIHIQADGMQYSITAIGMDKAFKLLIAFLLYNNLMENRRLIFFTDGARDIRDHISQFFAFREHTIILDWLHLEKKCMEYMSMSVKGSKAEKENLKKTLISILWTGRADKAIKYLKGIQKVNVKNTKKLEDLEGYIERKSPNLTCYALRHQLGLRISSNRVEKENDLVVASRQKHNGMAWSDNGSGALAVITAAKRNNELKAWIISRQIGFRLCA